MMWLRSHVPDESTLVVSHKVGSDGAHVCAHDVEIRVSGPVGGGPVETRVYYTYVCIYICTFTRQ